MLGIRSKTQVTKKVLDAAEFAAGGGRLLHRHQPGGARRRDEAGRGGLQRAVLQHPQRGRDGAGRDRRCSRGTWATACARCTRAMWKKVATGSHEVRGKTLGVVGYGHIGSQIGVLGRVLGMRVIYYDIARQAAARQQPPVTTLEALLEQSDFVTLHVPETAQTKGMMGAAQIAKMKKGALPDQRQPRHGGGPRGAGPGAQGRARRRRGRRRVPGGAGGEQGGGLQDAAAGAAQRDPHAAHRRLDARGAGGHRPRGGGQPGASTPTAAPPPAR